MLDIGSLTIFGSCLWSPESVYPKVAVPLNKSPFQGGCKQLWDHDKTVNCHYRIHVKRMPAAIINFLNYPKSTLYGVAIEYGGRRRRGKFQRSRPWRDVKINRKNNRWLTCNTGNAIFQPTFMSWTWCLLKKSSCHGIFRRTKQVYLRPLRTFVQSWTGGRPNKNLTYGSNKVRLHTISQIVQNLDC